MHRIMIVDDDGFVTLQLNKLLTSIGYDVVGVADSGKEAVEMARDVRPDLILMDIVLQGEPDGIGAAKEIMTELDIPVIFITGYTETEFFDRAKQAKPFGYLLKPFRIIQLKASIDIALEKRDLETRLRMSEQKYRRISEELQKEITERNSVYGALRESEKTLRQMSTHLIRAQEKERKRVALELHDELGQALSLLKLKIGSVIKALPQDQTELKNECKGMSGYIVQMVENVRRLSRHLSPRIIEDIGLSSALRWLAESSARHMDIEPLFEMDDIDSLLSPEAQITLYRIFQEAITNMVKYAKATRIWISARKGEIKNILTFIVKDNGVGFDLEHFVGHISTEKGLGLATMNERANMLGGSFEISSQKGIGTTITISVPIEGSSNS